MNLKDFAKQEDLRTAQEDKKPPIQEEKLEKVSEDSGDLVQEFMKRYGKMDQQQMMSELFKLIQQKKAEGTFDAEQIRKASEHIAPLLDDAQRAYMYKLLKYLN